MGPRAKPSAGSPKAALAIPPAARAPPLNSARRVTVSPSYAPGMPRSAVYFDFGLWGRSEGSLAIYRGQKGEGSVATAHFTVNIGTSVTRELIHASAHA